MKNSIIILLAISMLLACRNENKDKKVAYTITAENDTLSYTYDSVKVVSNHLVKSGINERTDTASAVVKYPIFQNDSLNSYLKRQVFNYFAEEEKVASYEDIASSFIRGYNEFYAENPGTAQWWYLLIDIKVIRQTHNYIALKYVHSDYTGGAHGNTSISYLNFNPKTNRPITLDSLIQSDKRTELLRIAESIFRKDEKLSPTEPLDKKYFFTDGKFSLPESYYIGDKGLVFLYNPYEIKSYAEGTTELVIPFSDLKNITKNNTILTTTE